jgi:two-component system, NtrC family, nitrogen regulation sensor histidine kinase NtrY
MFVNRLRHKLALVFVAATVLPLAATLWVSSVLMSRSLAFVATDDASALADSLERIGREYYRQARQRLEQEVASAQAAPERLDGDSRAAWPRAFEEFWLSGDDRRVILSEPDGERLQYVVRRGRELWVYTAGLDGVRLGDLTRQIREARARAGDLRQRNLPRGFTLALVIASAGVWIASLAVVLFLSARISRPIQRLTTGLGELAAGRLDTRLPPAGTDEAGLAVAAFNKTAIRLQLNRDRLVYLTQVASWQLLARKMAHELKNSLTPIRLTVEEIGARQASAGPEFFERATAIVVSEVTSLERRVRAFSEFAAEPDPHPARLDLAGIAGERVEFLGPSHPAVTYRMETSEAPLDAWADADHVRGILTNLLENAAEAAGDGGTVLVTMDAEGPNAVLEVHDSGPGVNLEGRERLFEPSISFKKHGMGLGLAISRKNALLARGDLSLVEGRLSGAGFRLVLPRHEERTEG